MSLDYPDNIEIQLISEKVKHDELIKFSYTLEKVCVSSVEKGYMTKDLAILINKDAKYQTTTEFLETINSNLKKELN